MSLPCKISIWMWALQQIRNLCKSLSKNKPCTAVFTPSTSKQHSHAWFPWTCRLRGNSIIFLDKTKHLQTGEGCWCSRPSKFPLSAVAFGPAPGHTGRLKYAELLWKISLQGASTISVQQYGSRTQLLPWLQPSAASALLANVPNTALPVGNLCKVLTQGIN